MLCLYCDNLSLELLGRTGYHHAPSYAALLGTATTHSCELCCLFINALGGGLRLPASPNNVFGAALKSVNRQQGVWVFWTGDVSRDVRVGLRREENGELIDRYGQLHMYVGPDSVLADKIDGREVFSSADSPGALAQVDSWINDCVHNHPRLAEDARLCQDLTKQVSEVSKLPDVPNPSVSIGEILNTELSPLLPTRVLDVGPSDGSQAPFLYEPEAGTRAYYITLSHCWGPPEHRPLDTKVESLSARKEQIPENDLPKTFKEAVFLTRRIGIRYLWIDSLCIIQNSNEDWQHEAALMGQYYTKSFLTITAAGSTASNQGCFLPRENLQPVQLNLKRTVIAITKKPREGLPDEETTEVIQTPLEGGDSVYMSLSDSQVPFQCPEPVDTRAWILQETALSPRVLIFGQKMLAYLCTTHHTTERGDQIVHSTPAHYIMAPRLPHHLRHAPDYDETDVAWMFSWRYVLSESSTWWAKIVQNYSKRSLTVETDKLVAIAGCAREIGRINKDSYFAGLWGKTCHNDLLWQGVDGRKASRASVYVAPSWSWASLKGEVKCMITGKHGDMVEKLVKGLTVQGEWVNGDRYGQVRWMSLFLEGSPARIKIKEGKVNKNEEWADGNKIHTLETMDPPCQCDICVGSLRSFQELAEGLSISSKDNIPPSGNTFSAMTESADHLMEGKTTFRYTGLQGDERGDSGPQFAEGDFNLGQADIMMKRQILEHFGTMDAGSATFDVESEVEDSVGRGLFCLPVTRQFGLLVAGDGALEDDGENIPRYKRVGILKLSLSWNPPHKLMKLVMV